MSADLKKKMSEKMDASIQHLRSDLSTIRTGRASLALFDAVRVSYYGTITPLKQVASLSIQDSRTVIIQPWDLSQIQEIEKAIMSSGLGLSPSNDGKQIRITIPPLSEERRRELVKLVKKMGEECRVAIRNIRRETNDVYKAEQKAGLLSEDVVRKAQSEVQKITDQKIAKVDEILRKKEEEVLEV